jgi:Na+/H+ antiporter NhaC
MVSAVAPVLLRTAENKDLAGRFYGRILRRFYKIAFFLLLVYLILGFNVWWGSLLLAGFSLNVAVSMWLRNYKRRLGNIEDYSPNAPERVRFRRVSYLSTALLIFNLLLSSSVLLKEVASVNERGAVGGVQKHDS